MLLLIITIVLLVIGAYAVFFEGKYTTETPTIKRLIQIAYLMGLIIFAYLHL